MFAALNMTHGTFFFFEGFKYQANHNVWIKVCVCLCVDLNIVYVEYK